MIDLDELIGIAQDEIDSGDGNIIFEQLDNFDALEILTFLSQAEKDAARYRWLCTSKIYDQFDSIDQVFYANKGDTDKAIDEAMQCSK